MSKTKKRRKPVTRQTQPAPAGMEGVAVDIRNEPLSSWYDRQYDYVYSATAEAIKEYNHAH